MGINKRVYISQIQQTNQCRALGANGINLGLTDVVDRRHKQNGCPIKANHMVDYAFQISIVNINPKRKLDSEWCREECNAQLLYSLSCRQWPVYPLKQKSHL